MKAYVVGLKSNPDVGNEIIFAKNSKEARKKAEFVELTDYRESYIDVTVHRCKAFDDKENIDAVEMDKIKWNLGWWFFQDGCPDRETSTDEDFYEWHKSIFGRGEIYLNE